MIEIKLSDNTVCRGQVLRGSVHISSPAPYNAKRVRITLLKRDKYSFYFPTIRESTSIEKVLYDSETIEIDSQGTSISFEYTLPEDAPFSFWGEESVIEWLIDVSVKKPTIGSETMSKKFVVLPHILESDSPPPLDTVPKPVYESSLFREAVFRRPFHLWLFSGPFSKSKHVSIHMDKNQYYPGDHVSGRIMLFDYFRNARFSGYLVFLNKSHHVRAFSEIEQLIFRLNDTFQPGSHIPFSFSLPLEIYPDLEAAHSQLYWKVRAVIRRRFHFTKVVESRLHVQPLKIK